MWRLVWACAFCLGCVSTAPYEAMLPQGEGAPVSYAEKRDEAERKEQPPPPAQARRVRLSIEGLFAFWEGPKGAFGEGTMEETQIQWDAIGSPQALGFRLGAMFEIDRRNWIEGRWASFSQADGNNTLSGVFGSSAGDGSPQAISDPNSGTFSWAADVNSVEVNWWRSYPWIEDANASGVLGLRVIRHDEQASANSWMSDFGFGPNPFVRSDTENLFLGAQAGFGVSTRPRPKFEALASLKLLFGLLERDITVDDQAFFGAGPHTDSLTSDDFVFGLDIDLGLRFWIAPKFAVTVGYNLLLLDDITRAHSAQDFSRTATGAVRAKGSRDELVVHSLLIGVVFEF